MKKISIKLNKVSKTYYIGEIGLKRLFNKDVKKINALNNLNLNIYEGDILGVLGTNGSGKSTLLKLISGIVMPTSGSIFVKYKITSMIEFSYGFHEEMNGMENVFFVGSLFGKKKAEMKKKIQSIFEFANLVKFIDTPLKRYTPGMLARLGFSIALHIKNEILIIDETLSVLDDLFINKVFKAIKNSFFKTVIIVGHDIKLISSLCNRGILLNKGNLILDGRIKKVVKKYKDHNF